MRDIDMMSVDLSTAFWQSLMTVHQGLKSLSTDPEPMGEGDAICVKIIGLKPYGNG